MASKDARKAGGGPLVFIVVFDVIAIWVKCFISCLPVFALAYISSAFRQMMNIGNKHVTKQCLRSGYESALAGFCRSKWGG